VTEPEFRAGECNETSGFLFPHRCGQLSSFECEQCRKPICHQHVAAGLGQGTLCTTCGKAVAAPKSQHDRRDDPYFYSDHYYTGYYWGDADFNDADEAVLRDARGPDDVGAFENDMGAS